MQKELPTEEQTPFELRNLVKISVAHFGAVVDKSVGSKLYQRIESIRQSMANLRDLGEADAIPTLRQTFKELEGLSHQDRKDIARAFTLMLELINSCENAYRNFRLMPQKKQRSLAESSPQEAHEKNHIRAVVYVLTAHPTEARAPENIAVFHMIQKCLTDLLENSRSQSQIEMELRHLLELTWRTAIVREKAPEVGDEAEHIYATLLDPKILDSLLMTSEELVPVFIRSWVGGDKDGHPGVNEKIMKKSLHLSRLKLVEYILSQIQDLEKKHHQLVLSSPLPDYSHWIHEIKVLRSIKEGDGTKIRKFHRSLEIQNKLYSKKFGAPASELIQLERLIRMFPGLVIPLELRESSDVLLSDTTAKSQLAIDRMLRELALISKGGDPQWYVRGFVVSMTSSLVHLRVASQKIKRAFGTTRFPVIPLFETAEALQSSEEIVGKLLKDPKLGTVVRKEWNGYYEMMVGYSDSAKESGVLSSRLNIAESMHRLEKLCQSQGITPVFFQGSGGSVDRGGGSTQDQMAWWPHSALRTYKVTIQGEMVERSLASPQIARGQIEGIVHSANLSLKKESRPLQLGALKPFAKKVAESYQRMTHDPDFLSLIEKATPYSDLGELKLGSRPTRRTQQLSVEGLRAIPWVFCWTQTRVLFPTWWGIGEAWKNADGQTRKDLKSAYLKEPVFTSYLKALGFTLAKVELAVWRLYLEKSSLKKETIERYYQLFEQELKDTLDMLREVSNESELVWSRPWLGASIRLRSTMIHPLNLLQIIALKKKDFALLRVTATGISSGMLTTG